MLRAKEMDLSSLTDCYIVFHPGASLATKVATQRQLKMSLVTRRLWATSMTTKRLLATMRLLATSMVMRRLLATRILTRRLLLARGSAAEKCGDEAVGKDDAASDEYEELQPGSSKASRLLRVATARLLPTLPTHSHPHLPLLKPTICTKCLKHSFRYTITYSGLIVAVWGESEAKYPRLRTKLV